MSEPLYLKISGILRRGILSGDYKPRDMLPSENELALRFRTSRVTVRKSFDVLEREGLVRPWHGKGYFVLPPRHTAFTLYFGDSMAEGQYRFQEVNMVQPAGDVAEALQLRKDQLAIVTRRIFERDGCPVAYEEKFIPYERGVPSIEFEINFTEFPEMFEKRFSPLSLHTYMNIGVEPAPEHISAALGLPEGVTLLVVSRLIRASDDKPVGYGKQYMTEEFGKLTAKSGYFLQEI